MFDFLAIFFFWQKSRRAAFHFIRRNKKIVPRVQVLLTQLIG
uniref:Uncharacterized protein n=1 Tax=Arundo donax TaxID=35708 RepID=A0A0A9BUJ4_ARUDO